MEKLACQIEPGLMRKTIVSCPVKAAMYLKVAILLMNGIFVPRTVFVTESALRYDACERIIANFARRAQILSEETHGCPPALGHGQGTSGPSP